MNDLNDDDDEMEDSDEEDSEDDEEDDEEDEEDDEDGSDDEMVDDDQPMVEEVKPNPSNFLSFGKLTFGSYSKSLNNLVVSKNSLLPKISSILVPIRTARSC